MGMASEFKEFISRGNVVDLAVGVVIGAAFGKIVTSLVDQIVMPIVGLIVGGVDFAALKIVLKPAGVDPKANPETAILYGAFINTVIQFLVIALVVFLVVKGINILRRQQGTAPPPTPTETLLMEIRDSLKAKPAVAVVAAAPKAVAAKRAVKKAPAKA